MIRYTIEAGLKSRYVDYVLVSTDDEEIAQTAKVCGAQVPFLRPAELAGDTSRTVDAVIHAAETLKQAGETFDSLVLLQPTSPLRTAEDIDGAIEKFYTGGRRGVVSVSAVGDHPVLIRTIEQTPAGDRLKPLLEGTSTVRRQDMPAFFRVNGCIYINAMEELNGDTSFNDNPVPWVMAKSHSVDIDEPADLVLAEYLLNAKE